MSDIKVTWDKGAFNPQKHYIYRSQEEIDVDNLPSPIGEVSDGVAQYIDSDGNEDSKYVVASEVRGILCPSDVIYVGPPFDVDPFGDNSGMVLYPLLEEEMYLDYENTIELEVGFREQEGFSIPISPVQDGSYSNRIATSFPSQATSFSFWYKSYGITGQSYQILLDPRHGSGSGWLGGSSSGGDRSSSVSTIFIDGVSQSINSTVFSGAWRHIYVQFSSTTDGVMIGSRLASTSYDPSSNGLFRSFRAFNRTLSSAEINEIKDMDSPL